MVLTIQELKEGRITKEVNEIIVSNTEPILIIYANWYKRDPKGLLREFLNNEGVRMIACLIIFTCRKNGLLGELKGKKDFKEWVNKQNLEERWKPVMENFLLILWGCTR